MAYEVYMDDILLPITPGKIQMKIRGQNSTTNLISGEEINVIRAPGLSEISFDAVFPQQRYPFARYDGGFEDAGTFLDHIAQLKDYQKPFRFLVIREGAGGKNFHDTNMEVTLEDYKVTDDAKEGVDILVSFNLKEYRYYGTQVLNISIEVEGGQTEASAENTRETENAPTPKTYTVKKGDCLWNIAKKELGNAGRYKEIYELNKDKIRNPNLIYPGQVLALP